MLLAPGEARGNSLVTINGGVRFICSPFEEFNMSLLRSRLLIALSTTLLGSTAASAGPVTVTSYEMNNGNGVLQNGDNKYFDSTYTVPTYATTNGSSSIVPSNAAPKEAPLSGGVGKLTDGVIPNQNYSGVP